MIRLDSNKTPLLNSIYDDITDYVRKTFKLNDFFENDELAITYPGETLSASRRNGKPAIGTSGGTLTYTEISNPDNLTWELGNSISHSGSPHRKRLATLWRDNDAAIALREQKAVMSFSLDVQLTLPSRHVMKRMEQTLIDLSKGRSFHEVDVDYKDTPPRSVLMILLLYYKQRTSLHATMTFQQYLTNYMLATFDYVTPKDQSEGRTLYFPSKTKALLKIEYSQDNVEKIVNEGTHASNWAVNFTITGQFTYREGYIFDIPAVVENNFTPSELLPHLKIVTDETKTVKIPHFDATHIHEVNHILSLAFTLDVGPTTSIDITNLDLCTLHPTILDILQDQSEADTINGHGLYRLSVFGNGTRVNDPSICSFNGTTFSITTSRTDMRLHLVLEEMLDPGKMSDDTVYRLLPKYGWFLTSKAVNAYIKYHNTNVLISKPKRETVKLLDQLRTDKVLTDYINQLITEGGLTGKYIEYGEWTTETLGYMFVNMYHPEEGVQLIYKIFEYAETDGYVIPLEIQSSAMITRSAELLGYTEEDRYGPISNGSHVYVRVLRNDG